MRTDPPVHTREIAAEPADVRACLRELAGSWDAKLIEDGDGAPRLALAVLAGARAGWVGGSITVEAMGNDKTDDDKTDGRSRVVFRVEESEYRLVRESAFFLTLAGLGAAVLLVAPFWRPLHGLLPFAIFATLGGWLFLVARMRNSGPEEFLDALVEECAAQEEDAVDDSAADDSMTDQAKVPSSE